MKILFFVGEFPKLSQTFILNQITGLIDAGHDIKIIAKRSAPGQRVHADAVSYRLAEKTVYYDKNGKNGKLQKVFSLIKNFSCLSGALLFGKNVTGRVSLKELIRYPNLVFLIRTLSKTDLSDREVILAHFGPNGILARKCIEMGLLKGRLFTAFHGYDMLRYINEKGKDAYRDLFHSPAVLLPISNFWEKRCIELGADPKRITVHHMGIDLKKFSGYPARPERLLRIVSAARFVEKKGLEYGIAAVARLVEKGYNVHYEIAGDGPLKDKLNGLISLRPLADHVHLAGWKTQDEWIEIMKDAQIVLAPSVTADDGDMEGIPVQLMEAMAMEKIVVSTVHSGIPELIHDRENGYLVMEKDAEGLADTIERIMKNTDKWPELVRNARRTVESQCNIVRQNEKLIQIFEGEKPL
ncbi:glycosyltransferase [Sporolactobacillus pectinivorans]|uniref:glycosyltransferase n=1 Tax=Sporolactobacillus pectinivorans TaxID=1591408 RepID=UPI000C2575DC|nr:glycosyltransferase [Sporolactobacillus pectinivorans]